MKEKRFTVELQSGEIIFDVMLNNMNASINFKINSMNSDNKKNIWWKCILR